MTDEAKPEKTPEQILKGLERKASQAAMIKAGEPAIVELCKAHAAMLDALEKIVNVAAEQKAAALEATAFAAANGLATSAKELGRAPLLAAALYATADVRLPPRDPETGAYVLARAWMRQFVDSEDGVSAGVARAHAIQSILNDGEHLPIDGLTPEQVARELIAGRDPRKAAPSKPAPAPIGQDAPGWYGFKGSRPGDANVSA